MTCSKPHENSVFKEEARVSMLLIGFRAEKTPMDLATWKMEMAVTKTSGESCASWELGISSRGVSGRQSSQVQLLWTGQHFANWNMNRTHRGLCDKSDSESTGLDEALVSVFAPR